MAIKYISQIPLPVKVVIRGEKSPNPRKKDSGFQLLFCDQSRISIKRPQQTGMGWPALMCSVRLQR